ncbi:hypothetical protein [Novosphingobium sp. 9]|uniref:hypothetical protein n=1 Tax=Novosphingobium sp. 9 TaxID=2025349 RepID=UPI0021B5BB08|nr:hypothetical protein [Novosphingobium sp. 9]
MTKPTDDASAKLEAHRAALQASGAMPMTAEEILAGQTQAGVPRPSFLTDHEDDGTVESVSGPKGTP